MATKAHKLQGIMRLYKQETGIKELDMHKVAAFAKRRGYPMPKPEDALDLLAKELSAAAREETKHDKKTGRPYRVNHAYKTMQGSQQLTLWIDIDEAPREPFRKSLINRREQMVGDGLQLTLDADHWNSVNQDKEPVVMPLDLTDDVEWRKNAPNEDEKAS